MSVQNWLGPDHFHHLFASVRARLQARRERAEVHAMDALIASLGNRGVSADYLTAKFCGEEMPQKDGG